MLAKGLSFSPLPTTPLDIQKLQLVQQFDKFTQSLRPIYVHATRKPNTKEIKHDNLTKNHKMHFLYRPMSFLPRRTFTTFTQIFSGEPKLEYYIDITKHNLENELTNIFNSPKHNLSTIQRQAVKCFKSTQATVTIKPADKNLRLVVLDTDDYIHLCASHLADHSTYRQATDFPSSEILKQLETVLSQFSHVLRNHKPLFSFLQPQAKNKRTPRFYGIPKIHKPYTNLPPIRPIVSHSNSLLSPSAKFIDHLLQPLARTYHDYLHNSTALLRLLQTAFIPDHAILVTIDVEGLYPSIPQDECLSIVYDEMHAKSDLLLFDPNLVIKLLHVNVNFNYFEFGPFFFQQIKGTAMGAAFSPTIANIFLSVTLKRFLSSQPKQPLLLKRYIDDVFMVWDHPLEDLLSFLAALNSFHRCLHYTWKFSMSSIDYLDITIFKGPTFPITNLLDTKTFQKPKNLYQYLHYQSCHPKSVFKSIITGECIRYIRASSSPAYYQATVTLFKQRLARRHYPANLVDKTIHLVKYSNRPIYLKETVIPSQTRPKPIFKCLPRPQFSYLKTLILQHYQLIEQYAPRPRFISLRYRTLGQELIRSKLSPTDQQFIDIVLTIGHNTTNMRHVSDGKMPVLHDSQHITQKCKNTRCATCPHLNCDNIFRSSVTGKTYPVRHSFSCSSSKLVYLITCSRCKKQYVGYTTNELRYRICRHRSNIINNRTIYVCIHFNFPDHSLKNLTVQPIDTATNERELKEKERFWIHTLQTYVPKGLNVSMGSL